MTAIHNKGILVNITIGQWSTLKRDSDVAMKIISDAKAASDSGKFFKVLMRNHNLNKYNSIATSLRRYHYDKTLPWLDGGMRLLPRQMISDYITVFNDHKSRAMHHVQEFIDEYDDIVVQSKDRLGDLYKPTDYPPKEVVRAKFKMDVSFLPIPDIGDWRLKVTEEEEEYIRESIKNDYERVLADATKEAWARLYKSISHAADKLSDMEGRLFRSVIDHLNELADILPKMNIAGDPVLNKMADDVRLYLGSADIDALRTDVEFRKQIAEKAQEILEEVKKNQV